MFKRLFKKTKVATNKATTTNPTVCRITVYNRAIKVHVAQYDIKASERHLVGALRAQYPSHTYRVEIVNY